MICDVLAPSNFTYLQNNNNKVDLILKRQHIKLFSINHAVLFWFGCLFLLGFFCSSSVEISIYVCWCLTSPWIHHVVQVSTYTQKAFGQNWLLVYLIQIPFIFWSIAVFIEHHCNPRYIHSAQKTNTPWTSSLCPPKRHLWVFEENFWTFRALSHISTQDLKLHGFFFSHKQSSRKFERQQPRKNIF